MNLLVIGLTGGIGAGKTTAAKVLESFGADVIDVDQIGRDLYELDSAVREQVINVFGGGILEENGLIDRKKLAAVVFSDARDLEALEAITHPAINRILQSRILKRKGQTVVLDMAILVEKKLGYDGEDPMYDKVVVVESARELRVKRLESRGLTIREIHDRFDSQPSDSARRAVADYIIQNDGKVSELHQAVKEMWQMVEIWRIEASDDCIEGEDTN